MFYLHQYWMFNFFRICLTAGSSGAGCYCGIMSNFKSTEKLFINLQIIADESKWLLIMLLVHMIDLKYDTSYFEWFRFEICHICGISKGWRKKSTSLQMVYDFYICDFHIRSDCCSACNVDVVHVYRKFWNWNVVFGLCDKIANRQIVRHRLVLWIFTSGI